MGWGEAGPCAEIALPLFPERPSDSPAARESIAGPRWALGARPGDGRSATLRNPGLGKLFLGEKPSVRENLELN